MGLVSSFRLSPCSPTHITMSALAPRRVALGGGRSSTTSPRAARGCPLICRADSVLIANTKGGGHAFLGLHLARKLVKDGHSVTILNDGEEVRMGGVCARGAACPQTACEAGERRMRRRKKEIRSARERAFRVYHAHPGLLAPSTPAHLRQGRREEDSGQDCGW